MTSALATLGLIVAAWLCFAALTALTVGVAWRAASAKLRHLHPRRRAAIALVAALAPSAGPTLLVLLCLSPGLVDLLGWHGDHCLRHGDHPHLCLVHWTGALDASMASVLALGAGAAAFVLARGGASLLRTRRFLSALRESAIQGPDERFSIALSTSPFSVVTGLARREIWVSSALMTALSRRQLELVLLHERAHLERRDPLRRAAAELLSLPLWPATRRAVLAELALATEQACDEVAADRAGTRVGVAETLLVVERLAGPPRRPTPYALPAFGGPHVAARVRSLLEDVPADPPVAGRAWAAALALVTVSWLAADLLHHLAEHSLRFLLQLG